MIWILWLYLLKMQKKLCKKEKHGNRFLDGKYASPASDSAKIMNMIIDEHISSAFANELRVEAVYLLGSAANGHMRPDSDIDIALLPISGATLDAFARNEIATSLSLDFGRDVDIGIISSGNLIYSYQAIMTGRRIFTRNPSQTDKRILSLLGMYEQFIFERKEVSDAYST
jgi:predicted nucleotidyltransferase